MNTLQLTEKFFDPTETVSLPVEYLMLHMPKAHPMFNMVYLYGYTLFVLQQASSNQVIAQKLNMLESDVIKAWEYWEQTDLIQIVDRKNFREFSIVFKTASIVSTPSFEIPVPSPPKKENHTSKLTATQYDPVVKNIMKIAQRELGLLSPTKAQNILSFYFDYHLPVEVIEELFRYCKEKKKLNIHYMEAIAKEWSNAGVDSIEKARLLEREFGEESNLFFQIQKIIGIQYDGQIKDAEKEKYERWTKKYGYTLEIITLAAEIAIQRGVKGNPSYIDGILKKWYKDGVRIKEDIPAAEEKMRQKYQQTQSGNPSNPLPQKYIKRSTLKNYKEEKVDYSKVREINKKLTAKELLGLKDE